MPAIVQAGKGIFGFVGCPRALLRRHLRLLHVLRHLLLHLPLLCKQLMRVCAWCLEGLL